MNRNPRQIERVRRSLLALLGTVPQAEPTDHSLLDADGDADGWAMLDGMARQHRLQPLLHCLLEDRPDAASRVPESWREVWRDAYRRSTLQALAAKATMVRAARILDDAGIAHAALKGAWLAWHAYPHPAMRPMRDLDILVAPASLEQAYRALVANGFADTTGAPLSHATLAQGLKHLPALRDATTGIHVEIHGRLFEHVLPAQADAFLSRPDDLLAARQWLPLERARIAYLGAEENLLHLAVHSACEHRFDNGPQVLHDIARLLAREAIDWPRFWILAREGGWERGCRLVLALTERFLGPQPIVPASGATEALPPDIVDKAALMLLQDTALRNDLDVQLRLGSMSGASMRHLLSRFVPPRRVIADYARLPHDSRAAWLHYPGWLASRLARTARGAFDKRQRSEVARASAVECWLQAD